MSNNPLADLKSLISKSLEPIATEDKSWSLWGLQVCTPLPYKLEVLRGLVDSAQFFLSKKFQKRCNVTCPVCDEREVPESLVKALSASRDEQTIPNVLVDKRSASGLVSDE